MSTERAHSHPLSKVDTAWLRMEEPTNLMTITCLMLFDQPLNFQRLRETIGQRLLRFERFTQRVVLARRGSAALHWAPDPYFDLSAHLHRIALPAPGNRAALEDLISDMMSAPLDFSKPLWQMHVIEGYGAGCALLMRLHHCIADGVALRHIMLDLLDERPDAPVAGANSERSKQRRRQTWPLLRSAVGAIATTVKVTETLLHEGRDLVNHPEHALALAGVGASGAAALGKLLVMTPDPKTAFKGRLGVPKRAAWAESIRLADVKAVGRVTGSTVNDVLLAAITGALRCYLLARAEPVDGARFRAVIPVNLLPPDAAPDGGNHFGLVFATLPLDLADSIERLDAIKREMGLIKQSPEAVVTFGILNAMGLSAREMERLAVDFFEAKATAVITNVPGPRQALYLAGAPIRQSMFWVPQAGRLGLGISILSYAGTVQLGIATDAGLVPDPEKIVAAFHAEFEQLVALAHQAEAEGEPVGERVAVA